MDIISIFFMLFTTKMIFAAKGYARSTVKVGVCLVTGIVNANYDNVPLVCFTGQVPTCVIVNDMF